MQMNPQNCLHSSHCKTHNDDNDNVQKLTLSEVCTINKQHTFNNSTMQHMKNEYRTMGMLSLLHHFLTLKIKPVFTANAFRLQHELGLNNL